MKPYSSLPVIFLAIAIYSLLFSFLACKKKEPSNSTSQSNQSSIKDPVRVIVPAIPQEASKGVNVKNANVGDILVGLYNGEEYKFIKRKNAIDLGEGVSKTELWEKLGDNTKWFIPSLDSTIHTDYTPDFIPIFRLPDEN